MKADGEKPRLRLVPEAPSPDDDGPAPLRVVPPRSNIFPLRPTSPPPDDPPRGAA
jgi:hypothetical protein